MACGPNSQVCREIPTPATGACRATPRRWLRSLGEQCIQKGWGIEVKPKTSHCCMCWFCWKDLKSASISFLRNSNSSYIVSLSRHHLTLPWRIANSTECNVSWFQVALLAHIPKCAIGVDESERSKGCVHHLPSFQLKKILHLSPISIRSPCFNVCFSSGWPTTTYK